MGGGGARGLERVGEGATNTIISEDLHESERGGGKTGTGSTYTALGRGELLAEGVGASVSDTENRAVAIGCVHGLCQGLTWRRIRVGGPGSRGGGMIVRSRDQEGGGAGQQFILDTTWNKRGI